MPAHSPPGSRDPAADAGAASPAPSADPHPRAPSAPVNWTLIICSVLASLPILFGDGEGRLAPLFISSQVANSPAWLIEVRHGQVWRLFTPAFLHFTIQHLGFNMLGLKSVGDVMEQVHGSRFYLFLTATLALASNLGQYFIYGGPNFGGMSGVLYGLFGYLWTRGLLDRGYPVKLTRESIVLSLVWFVACFTGALGPIGNGAHAVGLVLGAVWGLAAGWLAATRVIPEPHGPGVDPGRTAG